MAGLGKHLVQLHSLRRRFEKLVTAARQTTPSAEPFIQCPNRLREIAEFGANPGSLRMLAYVPDHLPPEPALVVALHGCTQTAAGYDHGTGWSTLADHHGFVVIYPEQQHCNNAKCCFSWFLPGDTTREHGEASSIRQMIERATMEFGVDRRRVYVTGLSAGGAMASVMLATYPEVFAGGAIIAGLPYGCATNVQEAFAAMLSEHSRSARALGDQVRAASAHRGPWPRISVWHGSADPIVKPSNAESTIRQWASVHRLNEHPSHEEKYTSHNRRVWNDATGNTLIEAITVNGMGHGVPLSTGEDRESSGAVGPFFLDVGISSTHHIARFWGLDAVEAIARPVGTTLVSSAAPAVASSSELDVTTTARDDDLEIVDLQIEADQSQHAPPPADPNSVIAAAFEAAGLAPPDRPSNSPDVAPSPIIEAALKAAGLMPR
jgi:poly(hydroxyalkanoate) depolymerase family esterase